MLENQESLMRLATIALVCLGAASVVLYKLGLPRRPDWLPAALFLLTMLGMAASSILSLSIDPGASTIQGVILVTMVVAVSTGTSVPERTPY